MMSYNENLAQQQAAAAARAQELLDQAACMLRWFEIK